MQQTSSGAPNERDRGPPNHGEAPNGHSGPPIQLEVLQSGHDEPPSGPPNGRDGGPHISVYLVKSSEMQQYSKMSTGSNKYH